MTSKYRIYIRDSKNQNIDSHVDFDSYDEVWAEFRNMIKTTSRTSRIIKIAEWDEHQNGYAPIATALNGYAIAE